MTTEYVGETKPAAGVIATRPLTAPQQKLFKDIFRVLFTSISVNIQLSAPTLAAKFETTIAFTALELTKFDNLTINHSNY